MKVQVTVHTNSKKERIEKDLFGNLHVWVNQPPLEGKANQAAIIALAEFFNVSTTYVKLISGSKSKHKLFEIIKD